MAQSELREIRSGANATSAANTTGAANVARAEPLAKTRGWRALLATTDEVAPMIARLVLGAVMFPHGAQKALGLFGGYGFAGTVGFFGTMGVPAALAVLAIAAEFLGALGLLSGLLSRVAAFGIAVVMLVAIVAVHHNFGFFMNWNADQKGEGIEYHLLALGLAAIVIWRGGGALSIDRLLLKTLARKRT